MRGFVPWRGQHRNQGHGDFISVPQVHVESWRKHIGPLISRQGEELLPHKQSPLTDNRTVAPLVRSLREDSLFGVLNIARKALGQVLSNG
jgi:hypothetical protein